MSIDEKEHSLIFAGSVPQGYLVQLMRANFDRVIDGAAQAAEKLKENGDKLVNNNVDSVCLAISCVGRRLVLGSRSEEEIEVLKINLGEKTSIVGFYSNGELSPTIQGNPCDLHNQSMTLTQINESISKENKKAA